MTARLTPGELADAWGALPVRIEAVRVRRGEVSLPDYAGGARPTSVVELHGGGQVGFGENVAFIAEAHERFGAGAADLLSTVPGCRVGTGLGSGGTPYERAALEAALIDLAMRQAGLSLADLTGVIRAPLRFVVSFAADAEPHQRMRRWRAAGYRGDFKLDVDPSWPDSICAELARESGIAIFDFKGRGDEAAARRLGGWFRQAIWEDPPPGSAPARPSRDAPLVDARAVAAALSCGECVNLKAPRMGGPLELLRGLEAARAVRDAAATPDVGAGEIAYFGGMFEVAVGRTQARQLAALYCGDAPNDLAPHLDHVLLPGPGGPLASPPLDVRLDQPGFGSAGRK